MELNTIIGIIGMALILIAFLLDLTKKVSSDSIIYNLINIFGSGAMVYYAYTLSSWPFGILNGVWFISACYKLIWIEEKHWAKK